MRKGEREGKGGEGRGGKEGGTTLRDKCQLKTVEGIMALESQWVLKQKVKVGKSIYIVSKAISHQLLIP